MPTVNRKPRRSRRAADLYRKFLTGKPLTLPEAVLVNCFICNGEELEDCGGATVCPLYPHGLFKEPIKRGEE